MEQKNRVPDINDRVWQLLLPYLPGQKGQWGGVALDNRKFLNGVFWVLQSGATWRDLPPEYGKWNSIYQRFRRWRSSGTWEKVLELLIDDPDFGWLISSDERRLDMYYSDNDLRTVQSTHKYAWPWLRMICSSEYLLKTVPERVMQSQRYGRRP